MGVTSTQPTSRRGYLSQSELEQLANITITDATEADDRISQAEEMIDAYVGYQNKYMPEKIIGLTDTAGASTLTLETAQQNTYSADYFKLCQVEILGGTGVGQRRKITGNTKEGVLTVDTAWSTIPSSDSLYRIEQIGKFPRHCDVVSYTNGATTTYYKAIPEAIKRAVAAQIEYLIEMGDSFFAGDKSEMQSESIGDYSYTKGNGVSGIAKLISPKAKTLLNGIFNRTGVLVD